MPDPVPIHERYACWVFDCDGVLLDTNPLKTEAFHEVALPFGVEAAAALRDYHRDTGGLSRFHKFRHFFGTQLGWTDSEKVEAAIQDALKRFGEIVFRKAVEAPETEGMAEFVAKIPAGVPKHVISGSKQDELRDIFKARGLDSKFDEILGSPLTKHDHLERLESEGRLPRPAVFVGDGKYDHQAATDFGLDFIFMSGYTEFQGWEHYFGDHPVLAIVDRLSRLA